MSLIYTYEPGQINTFVALKPTLTGIYPKPSHVIWIMEESNQKQLQQLFKVKQHRIFVNQARNCQEAIEKYQDLHRKGDEFQIWCSDVSVLLDLNQCKSFLDEEEVNIVVFYPIQQIKDNLSTYFELKPDLHPKFMVATDEIHELVHLTYKKLKALNFVFFSDLDQTKIAFYGLEGMVNQPTNRKQIVQQFARVCIENKCFRVDVKELVQFYEDWQYNPPGNLVLEWYQKQNFFYKVLNRILRCNQHPFEIYYTQPFVADLFNHIRSCYSQKHQKKLTCYRGAYLSKQQIEKIKSKGLNEIVHNLGFMSTSLDPKIALQYSLNTLIIIEVENDKRQQMYDYGYIQCKEQKYLEEKQILFNVLSSFTIVGWKENAKWQKFQGSNVWITVFEVHLKYGAIPKIMGKNPSQRSQKEEIIYAVKQLQFTDCLMLASQFLALNKSYNPFALQHLVNYLKFEVSIPKPRQNNLNDILQYLGQTTLHRSFLLRKNPFELCKPILAILEKKSVKDQRHIIQKIFQSETYIRSCKCLKEHILKQKLNLFLNFCEEFQSNLVSTQQSSPFSIFYLTIMRNKKFQNLFYFTSKKQSKEKSDLLSLEALIKIVGATQEHLTAIAQTYKNTNEQNFGKQLKIQHDSLVDSLTKNNPLVHWTKQLFRMFRQILLQVQQQLNQQNLRNILKKIIKRISIPQSDKVPSQYLEQGIKNLKINGLILDRKHHKSILIPHPDKKEIISESFDHQLMAIRGQLSKMKNVKTQTCRIDQIQKQVIKIIERCSGLPGKFESNVTDGIQILRAIYVSTVQTWKLRFLNLMFGEQRSISVQNFCD